MLRYVMNCEVCGLPVTVEEHVATYVLLVGERAVSDCPQCGADLDEQMKARKAEGEEGKVEG